MDGNPFATYLRGAAITALFGGTLALAAGCGSGDSGSTGLLGLGVTDAPVDEAEEVVVQFDAVEIKPADGESQTFTFDSAKSIDLLAQQGENSASLLDDEEVAAGDYNWMRLHVTASESQMDSYITLDDGTQHSLSIPSGQESGLKLVRGFTVPANGSADFTIDFDLRKSVHDPESGISGGDYLLRPALRLVDNTDVGHIAAEVTDIQNCTNGDADGPAIYVFEGSGVTPDDVNTTDDNDIDPVSTAGLTDDGSGTYTGTAGFLTAGTYTVAFTCQAANDVNDADDNLNFEGTQPDVEVQADQTTTYSHTVN